ncbi:PRELI-like family-domain-containing protein [Limtongia smithiae]|uniref:PRELI-like family-domain-containing protein n=1 Tax=Limtongia smithiae TaxID=1125753 RepID=UPI0034CE9997
MKVFSSQHSFDYPWQHVSSSAWQKYPNEMSSHVVAVDVLRREFNHETGILTTERLITVKQPVPRWLLAIVGGRDTSYVREVSEVDPIQKTFTLRSQNLTMNNLLSVQETVSYFPDPNNTNKTVFDQTARIEAYASIQRLCNKIEDWSVERFRQNAALGRQGFESVLKKLASTVPDGMFAKDLAAAQ